MSFPLAPDSQLWAIESFDHTRHTCHQKVPLSVKISQKLCTAEQEENEMKNRREDRGGIPSLRAFPNFELRSETRKGVNGRHVDSLSFWQPCNQHTARHSLCP